MKIKSETKGNKNNDSYNIKVGDTIIYTGLKEDCIIIDKCLSNDYPRITGERVGIFPENLCYKADMENLEALNIDKNYIDKIIEGKFESPLMLFSNKITKERKWELIEMYVPKDRIK